MAGAERTLLLVAGVPGAGKTRFAEHLAEAWNLPLLCKDRFKELLWEKIRWQQCRESTRLYGALAYDMLFYAAEQAMRGGQGLILESNFTPMSADILGPLCEQHGYRAVTVRFEGDIAVIHRRFVERDATPERHPGLAVRGFYEEYEEFRASFEPCGQFALGELIRVDATDFGKVSYEAIEDEILHALGGKAK